MFFSYYGGKFRASQYYPPPEHKLIIEPFAGAAGYSTRHYSHDVILYDTDPKIAGLWDYLIHVKASEIRSLPVGVGHVDEVKGCPEAKWLIGFWFNKASTGPRQTPSTRMRHNSSHSPHWGETIRERIATQVELIRHWKVFNESYEMAPDVMATWFIDPPYHNAAGRLYRHHSIDYGPLGAWCRGRAGQVMVCEQEGADWLPFEFFRDLQNNAGKHCKTTSREVIWTNSRSLFNQ